MADATGVVFYTPTLMMGAFGRSAVISPILRACMAYLTDLRSTPVGIIVGAGRVIEKLYRLQCGTLITPPKEYLVHYQLDIVSRAVHGMAVRAVKRPLTWAGALGITMEMESRCRSHRPAETNGHENSKNGQSSFSWIGRFCFHLGPPHCFIVLSFSIFIKFHANFMQISPNLTTKMRFQNHIQ
jgi:hypothetical protein